MTARRWLAAPTWPRPVATFPVLAPRYLSAHELAQMIETYHGMRVLLKPVVSTSFAPSTEPAPPRAA